jgi:predicted 3-demethylubiquinone-9 3-methyltransferase (glyoxalase superfamily)
MPKVSPFLWFENNAEEAAKYYVEVFNTNPGKKIKSKIGTVTRYDKAAAKASGQPEGTAMTVAFELEGVEFAAINGGPALKMSGGVSFVIDCETQEEIDHFWEKLSAGGEAGQCGWINHDKFGMTWQVVPNVLTKYIGAKDPQKAGRAMQAMLKMTKLDIATLKKAYEGK